MDFIETLFGVSPDNGDGSLEMLWIGAIVVAVLAVVFRRRILRMISRTSSIKQTCPELLRNIRTGAGDSIGHRKI